VVPLAVSFCFFLRADANLVRWRALYAPRALPGPPEGQVAMSSQLNNPSCHIGNLAAHIPTNNSSPVASGTCVVHGSIHACAVRPNALWLVAVQCQKVNGAGTDIEVL
jgi:hypothetical protein